MKKKLSILGLLILPAVMLVSCFNPKTEEIKSSESEVVAEQIEKPENLPEATITIKGYGTLKAELYPHKAPNTVNNFIKLANDKFYDGLTIHRVIKGFVLQGGCVDGTGAGNPGFSINGEFKSNGFATNDIKHTKGVLSMARTSDPNSADTQFFIMSGDASHLDNEYAAFGKVTEGMEIIDKISDVKVGKQDMPKEEIYIESITIDMKGNEIVDVKRN